jgi:hypothetical protein
MKTKKRAAKVTKKPSTKRQQIIVLVDGAGNYYEISRETFERARVEPARKRKVAAAIQDVPAQFAHILLASIPGSTMTAEFKGGRQIRYAGFYVTRARQRR